MHQFQENIWQNMTSVLSILKNVISGGKFYLQLNLDQVLVRSVLIKLIFSDMTQEFIAKLRLIWSFWSFRYLQIEADRSAGNNF